MRSFLKKKCKKNIFGYFGPKRPILDHFWPKRGHFRIFGEKAKTSLFYSFFQYKNQKILMRGFSGKWARTDGRTEVRSIDSVERPKNAKNTHFWAFWAKKANFGSFWPKRGHFRIFGKKAKTKLFLLIF